MHLSRSFLMERLSVNKPYPTQQLGANESLIPPPLRADMVPHHGRQLQRDDSREDQVPTADTGSGQGPRKTQ